MFTGLEASTEADGPRKNKDALLEEARTLKGELQGIEKNVKILDDRLESLALELPNSTSENTPRGNDPKIVGYINEDVKDGIVEATSIDRDHVRLGAEYHLLDFAGAASTSGWGWYHLENEAGLLELAHVPYAIHIARKHGVSIDIPPSMVYSHISSACGFRPRDQSGEQQVYAIQQSSQDISKERPAHSMAGTAEIPLAGKKAKQVLEEKDLPIKIVGSSRCYRAEAGARGAQTKGLYRVHEFTKVEMFAWTTPNGELETFNAMLAVQKEILQSLGLHCRILEMPSPDLGASAVRKQDIEAYFPSRAQAGVDDGWGEVTSTSICTDC